MSNRLTASSDRGRIVGPMAFLFAVLGLLGAAFLVSTGIFRFP